MIDGYFEIGIFNGKNEHNIGTLWRSAYQLGAAGIFCIGKRIKKQSSDTYSTYKNIPYRTYNSFEEFLCNKPVGAQLIGIEMGGIELATFNHPKQAIYLLGAEDNGLPNHIQKQCQHVLSIESKRNLSYNVAAAGSLVMYHRNFGDAKTRISK